MILATEIEHTECSPVRPILDTHTSRLDRLPIAISSKIKEERRKETYYYSHDERHARVIPNRHLIVVSTHSMGINIVNRAISVNLLDYIHFSHMLSMQSVFILLGRHLVVFGHAKEELSRRKSW